MPIEFLCEHCGTKLRTPDGSSGKKTKCPKCEAVLPIPEQSTAPPQSTVPPQSTAPSASASPPLPPVPPLPAAAQPSRTGDAGEWQGFENPGSTNFNDFTFTESGNPWQAPADYGPEPRTFRSTSVYGNQLGFSQAFDMTYQTMKSNFLPYFLLGLIFIGWVIVITVINTVLQMGSNQEPNLIWIYFGFVFVNGYILQPLLFLGLELCTLELIRTGKTSAATGFSIFTQLLSLIVFWFLMLVLAIVVIGVPIGVIAAIGWVIENAAGDSMGLVFGFVLGIPWLVIASIVLGCRLTMFGPLLIVDQKVSAFQAFSMSWAMTRGNALTLFCIYLVFGLASTVAICCTCYLGSFVVGPFALCLAGMCYHIMWEQYSAKTPLQEVSEW